MSSPRRLCGRAAARTSSACLPRRAVRSGFVRACITSLSMLLALAGCGGGGGGGGGSDEAAQPAAVTSIDLAPGQTRASLAWEESIGGLDRYKVYESRNGAAFSPKATVTRPRYDVRGRGGDEVQILIVAVGKNGASSPASEPSPILRFYDPVKPAKQAAAASSAETYAGLAPPAPAPESGAEADSESGQDGEALRAATDEGSEATREASEANAETGTAEEASGASTLDPSLREAILAADPRLPAGGPAQAAAAWLQARVDEQMTAGVALLGTGRADTDALRELVWGDAAGQLFVSGGAALVTVEDVPQSFEETVRLGPSERFAGLEDFDGDGRGDWLIEDVVAGWVWLVDEASREARDVLPELSTASSPAQLLTHGDFDGDGGLELLWWQPDDDTLLLGPAGEDLQTIAADALNVRSLVDRAGQGLLLAGDFDGDGRDELLSRSAQGELAISRVGTDGMTGLGWEPLVGAASETLGLELLASLDLDGDGAAEIAWLDGEILEIRDPYSGELASSDTAPADPAP